MIVVGSCGHNCDDERIYYKQINTLASNGYKVTNPEGFVAIDRVSGGAVKLVDRMEFSFNNFTAIKAWDK